MHAASVHPEPGSNSRIFCINSLLSKCNYHSSFLLASFTFCLSSILFQNLTRSLSHYTLTRILYKFALYFLQSLVVQFSMTDFYQLLQNIQLRYYITFAPRLSSTFFNFFQTFFGFFIPPRSRPCYITTSLPLCQYLFWKKFSNFWSFFRTNLLTKFFQYDILFYVDTARWSSGQDVSLSRWKHGFDSRTGHQ